MQNVDLGLDIRLCGYWDKPDPFDSPTDAEGGMVSNDSDTVSSKTKTQQAVQGVTGRSP